ncbi:acyl-CoA dehydrogenase family protein [Sneathiella chinensis]|uniref:Acyl-CoA dehydrogenase n=1 Tax=Sneathiella chinensis TaxID=349750 RepID=A0ABQ5U0R4_9PROT|nr:acyl-CoA dehydrogenase family protein [Sneathiella chinensis]GLQ04908.1 acyl-CoA dehydrogenase [Sneathiella chinensis]
MSIRAPMSHLPTHEVENQPAAMGDINLYAIDVALQEAVQRENATWAEPEMTGFGAVMGRAESRDLARQADKHSPEIRPFDPYGRRINEVEFHPAYHDLMGIAMKGRVHNFAWAHDGKDGAHAAQMVLAYLFNQTEGGVSCPMAMTYAVYPALTAQADIFASLKDALLSDEYDRRSIPWSEKTGMTMGMFMTEKQGGSDVRANSTKATPVGAETGPGKAYLLNGHKWFCSAPMSDAFLTLAYTENGLTCFFLPRWKPDGSRNNLFIQRLKDKVGNRSNASSEMEFIDTYAVMVGPEGRGVPTIIEMVQHTRLFCIMGSAALMRTGLVQALYHANNRRVFQKRLIDQPLMRTLLADMALESEAASQLMMRVAGAFDRAEKSPLEQGYKRIGTAIGKYWVCKRTPNFVYEAMECHGGSGYVEENILGRMYRESPVNSIWEGSGNVMCLDVLRAMGREPESVEALVAELKEASGANPHYDAAFKEVRDSLATGAVSESRARWFTEQMAKLLQANILIRHAPNEVSDTFAATRLGPHGGLAYGTLPDGAPVDFILERAAGSLFTS